MNFWYVMLGGKVHNAQLTESVDLAELLFHKDEFCTLSLGPKTEMRKSQNFVKQRLSFLPLATKGFICIFKAVSRIDKWGYDEARHDKSKAYEKLCRPTEWQHYVVSYAGKRKKL